MLQTKTMRHLNPYRVGQATLVGALAMDADSTGVLPLNNIRSIPSEQPQLAGLGKHTYKPLR
jgi:hypothetical protein